MENDFITILGEALTEENVLTILKKYHMNIPEPEAGSFLLESRTDDMFAVIQIDNSLKTEKQRARRSEGNFYLQVIKFQFSFT